MRNMVVRGWESENELIISSMRMIDEAMRCVKEEQNWSEY